MNSPSSIGIGLMTVIIVAIVVVVIVSLITRYAFPDPRYQPVGDYANNDIIRSELHRLDQNIIKTSGRFTNTTDMLSQQVKNNINVSANLFRNIGFIRISPNTVLLSPSTSGLSSGFGGLPSCIAYGSPLWIFCGSPAFVDKLMAYKDSKKSATFLEAILAAIKSIGVESFRWRRRADAAVNTAVRVGSVNNYQLQNQANIINPVTSADITTLSTDDKALLTNFAAKYFYVIRSFDSTSGFPVVESISNLFITAGSTSTSQYSTIDPVSSNYQMIVNDIYRYNPHLLNSC